MTKCNCEEFEKWIESLGYRNVPAVDVNIKGKTKKTVYQIKNLPPRKECFIAGQSCEKAKLKRAKDKIMQCAYPVKRIRTVNLIRKSRAIKILEEEFEDGKE